MHQRQRRNNPLIGQIVVKLLDLIGQQQALVHNNPRRQRANVATFALLQFFCGANFQFVPLANHVQLPFEQLAAEFVHRGQ